MQANKKITKPPASSKAQPGGKKGKQPTKKGQSPNKQSTPFAGACKSKTVPKGAKNPSHPDHDPDHVTKNNKKPPPEADKLPEDADPFYQEEGFHAEQLQDCPNATACKGTCHLHLEVFKGKPLDQAARRLKEKEERLRKAEALANGVVLPPTQKVVRYRWQICVAMHNCKRMKKHAHCPDGMCPHVAQVMADWDRDLAELDLAVATASEGLSVAIAKEEEKLLANPVLQPAEEDENEEKYGDEPGEEEGGEEKEEKEEKGEREEKHAEPRYIVGALLLDQ